MSKTPDTTSGCTGNASEVIGLCGFLSKSRLSGELCGRTDGCGSDDPRSAEAVEDPEAALPLKRLPSENEDDPCFCSESDVLEELCRSEFGATREGGMNADAAGRSADRSIGKNTLIFACSVDPLAV